MTWWIGAIPSRDDPVWDVSSEKTPHMTILYLGDPSAYLDEDKVAEYVGHAASMLDRFGLSVDRRDVLGDDQADVIFFSDRYLPEDLKNFRTNLLRDSGIKAAYDSVEQYPKWNPHLTLGYPENPAGDSDESIRWVQFDKIAFWTEDFQGQEFPLEEKEFGMTMTMAVANDRELALEHFGVKGMKWGQRKAEPSAFGRTTRKTATFQTDRAITAHKQALSGRGVTGKLAKLDKHTWGGNGRFEGYHNKKIAQLERSKERISQGELVTRTILFGPVYSKLPKEPKK